VRQILRDSRRDDHYYMHCVSLCCWCEMAGISFFGLAATGPSLAVPGPGVRGCGEHGGIKRAVAVKRPSPSGARISPGTARSEDGNARGAGGGGENGGDHGRVVERGFGVGHHHQAGSLLDVVKLAQPH
jgi:hypothetical protein